MKRISIVLGFIAALFTMVSCQKDQTLIRASITRYHGDEKVHLNSTNYASWDGNEKIWINGNSPEYSIIPISSDDNEHFMIDMGDDAPESGTLYAIYHPSRVTLGTYNATAHTIGITLPETQTYTEDDHGNQVINAPMVAHADINSRGGADLIFSNVCALLKVQLRRNVFVYWIEVTCENVPLAGTGTLGITDTSLSLTSNTSTTVRLNVNPEQPTANSPSYRRSDGVYYIVLPPYTGKLTVRVFDNPKTLMTLSQSNSHTLNASEIGVVNVGTYDRGRGIFSVDANGTLVSFAPGNLTLSSAGTYGFAAAQEYNSTGSNNTPKTVFAYNSSNINTYSNAMGSNWTLLTAAQWKYLLNFSASGETPNVGRMDRWTDDNGTHARDLKARARLNGVNGMVLLPDGWFIPVAQGGLGLGSTYDIQDDQSSSDSYGVNDLDDNWAVMESYGAVFLPATGDVHQNRNHYYTATANQTFEFGQGAGYPVGGAGVLGTVANNTNLGGGAQVRLAVFVGGE